MAISNAQKRKLTCQFCTRKHGNCRCNKYWKEVYKENREKILEIYHESLSSRNEKNEVIDT